MKYLGHYIVRRVLGAVAVVIVRFIDRAVTLVAADRIEQLSTGRDKVLALDKPSIDVAVDVNGHRYTMHSFATRSDPWWGATILLPSTVARLEREGLLPLTELSEAVRALGGEA